jgi:hypothetical protein
MGMRYNKVVQATVRQKIDQTDKIYSDNEVEAQPLVANPSH